MKPTLSRLGLGLLLLGGGLTACKYPERGQPLERLEAALGLEAPNEGFGPPRMRFGTMPFDAWYSPLTPLSVDDLGTHAYVDPGATVGGDGNPLEEVGRGTLYTTRGGFLDISHIRNAVDLTRFCYVHIRASFRAGLYDVELLSAEPDIYHVTLRPPPQWRDLDPDQIPVEIDDQIHDAAIQIAGRIAYLMTTWHEVLTFFGYKGTGLITERPSAFSYDDAASHRVGVEVAMRALEHQLVPTEFDEFVTKELRGYLTELGVVDAEEMVRRVEAAEGKFWRGSDPYLRVVDLGQDGRPLKAELTDDQHEPITWDFPEDAHVAGHRVEDLYDVNIELKVFEAGAILEAIGREEGPVRPPTDFQALHDHIEQAFEADRDVDAADAKPEATDTTDRTDTTDQPAP